MTAFDYSEPGTLDDALELLGAGNDVHLMAGGTALVLLLKQGLVRPERVVGLRRIDRLRGIRSLPGGGLAIGAMTTHREAETSPLLGGQFRALGQAFGSVATIRIRNQATVGGNLVHADPAQDPPPMLLALDAEIELASRQGVRTVPLERFFLDYYETAIRPDEIVLSVNVPKPSAALVTSYLKFLPRTADDYATISVAIAIELDQDRHCANARVAFGSAGPTPTRARSVEAALVDNRLDPELVQDAVALLSDDLDPITDARGSAEYKLDMARVWLGRALNRLAVA